MTLTIISDSFSKHTKRAYQLAIADFERAEGLSIQEATQKHVDQWIAGMYRRRLSIATIRQRISALCHVNPGFEVALPKREMAEHTCMDIEQLATFLSIIPVTLTGHSDFTLIALSITFGLKNSEVRTLRWNQIIEKENHGFAIYLSNKKLLLPNGLQALIKPLINKKIYSNQSDYIFKVRSNRWRNLPTTNSTENNEPISSEEFNRRIKKYARLARLNEKNFSVRTLRYTLEFLGQERVIEIIESALRKRFPQPVLWGSLSHDPRLHGIGRRSR